MNPRLFLLLLPLAVVACTVSDHSATPDAGVPPTASTSSAHFVAAAPTQPATLQLYHWRLTEATDATGRHIDALFARPDKPLELDFVDGRLSVSNACNRLGGSYRIEGGKLQVNAMMHTMMACPDQALMALDEAIVKRLRNQPVLTLQTGSGTPRLKLVTQSGDVLQFDSQPTSEAHYGSQGETVFLEVAAQTMPCNQPLIPSQQCLKVRERHFGANGLADGPPGDWQPLQQDIAGYTHQPNVRNVLRVKRYASKSAPADAASGAYVLDIVVESEIVKH